MATYDSDDALPSIRSDAGIARYHGLYAMRPVLVLFFVMISGGVIGYLELRHVAERETWRAEVFNLSKRLERSEHLAEESAVALSKARRDVQQRRGTLAHLADLEAEILDAAVDLAQLETDRAVAQSRADKATLDLRNQVSALAIIERELATINERRQRLVRDVDVVEEQLERTEIEAAEREQQNEQLDRELATLAIRREAMLANLEAAEQVPAASTIAGNQEKQEPPASSSLSSSASDDSDAAPEAPPYPGPIPTPALASLPETDRDRTQGLYQFGSLSATPEILHDDGSASSPAPPVPSEEDEAENWADNQYLLGLDLLSTAEQHSGTRELNDAILAFKAVLGEWPKERDRMRWAIARSDLGYALALLGKRKKDVRVLEEATVATRDALAEFRRGETPLLWAAAQHHLGVSLSGLADVQQDQKLRQASIEALEQAIAAFKDVGAENDARKAEKRLREAYAGLPAAPE